MKVYTKTGDDGSTSLFSGGRVAKDDARIEAYGTVDELNAVLGLMLCEPLPGGVVGRLRQLQEDLFTIGSVLADAKGRLATPDSAFEAESLELWVDEMQAELADLRNFILPGGSRPAALAHLARTVCRRAERRVLTVHREGDGASSRVLVYLNRLSDFFFVLARFINARMGISDVEWKGEKTR